MVPRIDSTATSLENYWSHCGSHGNLIKMTTEILTKILICILIYKSTVNVLFLGKIKQTVPLWGSAAIQKSNNWKDRNEQWNNNKFVMRCLASNYKSKFHQATFLAVFDLQWTLAIRNSRETGNLFDILAITSSVQNLACIKFGDWQKSVFLAGIKFGQLKDLLNLAWMYFGE